MPVSRPKEQPPCHSLVPARQSPAACTVVLLYSVLASACRWQPLAHSAWRRTPPWATFRASCGTPPARVVPNATVTVSNTGTGAARTLTTDSDGHYLASFLQPGTYEVVLSGTGYGKVDQKNVLVTVGSTNTVDANLPLASVSTDVVVTADQVLVDADKVQASQTIGEELVSNLPVNGRRWDNFVLLTPNVAPDGNTGLISFRGISGIYNTNLVDGANNQQAFFSEARGRSIGAPYVYPLDAIQEFESSVSSYSAELGQSAGGVVNAITKSGTNQFHGDAFYYYRTPGFNALDPYNKYQGRTTNNPLLLLQPVKVQHQFGASVGGPILQDKLFFHMTYDGFRRVNPITYLSTYNNGTTSIPSLVALCDQRTMGYLTTGTGAKQAIFPSTIAGITPAQCSAAVDFISSTQLGAFARNTTQDIYFPRLDWQATAKTHLSASFLFENLKVPNGYNSGTTVSNGGVSQNGGINLHERFLTASAETSLTSRSTNVVHFQWSRDLETAGTNSGGPALSLTNLFAYGETSALPRGAFPDEHRWQITDIYSTIPWQALDQGRRGCEPDSRADRQPLPGRRQLLLQHGHPGVQLHQLDPGRLPGERRTALQRILAGDRPDHRHWGGRLLEQGS